MQLQSFGSALSQGMAELKWRLRTAQELTQLVRMPVTCARLHVLTCRAAHYRGRRGGAAQTRHGAGWCALAGHRPPATQVHVDREQQLRTEHEAAEHQARTAAAALRQELADCVSRCAAIALRKRPQLRVGETRWSDKSSNWRRSAQVWGAECVNT
jgi:hypothetical protein